LHRSPPRRLVRDLPGVFRTLSAVVHWRNLLGWAVPGGLLLALMYPSLLALLDHHAAERVPTHSHLAAGSHVGSAHNHGFEAEHGHGAAQASAYGEPTAVAFVDQEAVYVPGSGASGIGVQYPALALVVFAAGALLNVMAFHPLRPSGRPPQRFFAPLTLPPRRPLLAA
jgi:hypothetical protein